MKISFDFDDHVSGGLPNATGHVVFEPSHKHVHADNSLGTVRPFTVKFSKPFTVDLEVTAPGWAWKITVTTSGKTFSAYYIVDRDQSFSHLVSVDPETLEPNSEPEPAWWVMARSTVSRGVVVGDDLILNRTDGVSVNVGNVRGVRGLTGSPGANGAKGDTGARGLQGVAGTNGAPGAKGDKGDKGDAGTPGAPGTNGANGAKGDKGDKGDAGTPGAPGTNGANGAKGDKGDKGDTGARGLQGVAGTNGANGAKGDKGDKGDTGAPGAPGTTVNEETISNLFEGKTGWTLGVQSAKRWGKVIAWSVEITRAVSDIASSPTGDITNTTACSIPVVTNRPAIGSLAATGGVGYLLGGVLNPGGNMNVGYTTANTIVKVGDRFELSGVYVTV